MLGKKQRAAGRPRVPDRYRAYAVGDVHGRLDLLEMMLAAIERDVAERPGTKNLLIFLGDLIDRGPDSRGVIDRLISYRHDRIDPYFLAGNHEEVLLRLLAGEQGILGSWLKFGGAQCLASYGCKATEFSAIPERQALAKLKDVIPAEHQQFIAGFSDTLSLGDYLFVHAGIRPGVDLSLQKQKDLRWIRSPFIECEEDHGRVVIHGHTITDTMDERHNRIGIDTGAYRTGVLTAICLEGEDRRPIQVELAPAREAVSAG